MQDKLSKLWELVTSYDVYRETVHGGITDPVSLFYNMLSTICVDFPFHVLQWSTAVIGGFSSLLDISSSLKPVQTDMMHKAKTMFLSFIGGSNGTIAQFSGAGILLLITTVYLFYQYTNGKGHFLRSFFHLLAVVGTMFFFFGNFTYTAQGGQQKTAMGGQILFDTTTNISDKVKTGIQSGLSGVANPSDADFMVNYVLKPTANYVNSGNPEGIITHHGKAEKFDYKKAADDKKGEKYVNDLAKKKTGNPWFKNDGKYLTFQWLAIALGSVNLFIYALPIAAVNLTISGLTLLLCVFELLIPVSALLSFIPWCRNAFFGVLKHSLGLLVAPSFLGVSLSILFYIMSQVDLVVLKLMTDGAASSLLGGLPLLKGNAFLMFFPIVMIIKIAFMIMLWKSRKSITQIAMGESNGSDLLRDLNNTKDHAKEKVEGTAEVGAGAATGNPTVAMDGAQKVAPDQKEGNTAQHQEQSSESEIEDAQEETEAVLTPDSEGQDIETPLEDGEQDEIELPLEEQELDGQTIENEDVNLPLENDDDVSVEREDKEEANTEDFQDNPFVLDEEEEQVPVQDIDEQEMTTWEEAQDDLNEVREGT